MRGEQNNYLFRRSVELYFRKFFGRHSLGGGIHRLFDERGGLVDRDIRSRARDASAGATHALDQCAAELAHFCKKQNFTAVFQPLYMLNIHFCVGVICRDALFDGARNAARDGIAPARSRGVVHFRFLVECRKIDAPRLKNGGKLFERDDEIDVAAHRPARRFQFFAAHGPMNTTR